MKLAALSALLLASLVACGGSNQNPQNANAVDTEGDPNAPPDSESGAHKKNRDSKDHRDWMNACAQEPGMDAYCECSFDYIMDNTTAKERDADGDPKMKVVLAELPRQCGGKLPPAALRSSFVGACSTEPGMTAYCNCAFEYMYEHDLVTKGAAAARAAEPELKKACFDELYDISRRAFLRACEANQSSKMCNCTFNAMEKTHGKKGLFRLFESDEAGAKQAARAAAVGCSAK